MTQLIGYARVSTKDQELLFNAMLDGQNKFSHLNDEEIESLIEEGISAVRKKRKS